MVKHPKLIASGAVHLMGNLAPRGEDTGALLGSLSWNKKVTRVWLSHFPSLGGKVLMIHFEWVTHAYPRWFSDKEAACQCRRPRFNPWVEKIPWRRKWQPTPVFLPGKSHGQRSLAGYSPWDHKELYTTVAPEHIHTQACQILLNQCHKWISWVWILALPFAIWLQKLLNLSFFLIYKMETIYYLSCRVTVEMNEIMYEKHLEQQLPHCKAHYLLDCCCCSVAQLCLTICYAIDCSTPGFPVLHYLPEFAQTRVHWIGDATSPSHPLSLHPPPASVFLSIKVFSFCLLLLKLFSLACHFAEGA